MSKKNIDICLTPEMVRLFDFKNKNVVVIDIFRATTTMVAGLANGLSKIIPVSKLEDCQSYPNSENIIKAAERGGKKVEGFQFGNSPFDYIENPNIKDKTLIMTTTNGTRCINLSKEASNVLIGSFLNITSICDFLIKDKKDVILFCAGWQGHFNLEDTLFAGAVIDQLKNSFDSNSDGVISTEILYQKAKEEGIHNLLKKSSHYKRLSGFSNHKDIELALKNDIYNVLPVLKENGITLI